jgi:hypothetical protein
VRAFAPARGAARVHPSVVPFYSALVVNFHSALDTRLDTLVKTKTVQLIQQAYMRFAGFRIAAAPSVTARFEERI